MGPHSPPRLVNPSVWENTPPITHTIHINPAASSRMPAIRKTIFMMHLHSLKEFSREFPYAPSAFRTNHRASTANRPWNKYPGHSLGLKPEALPRSTSAMRYRIQTAPMNQATNAPIHHHIVASPPCVSGAIYRLIRRHGAKVALVFLFFLHLAHDLDSGSGSVVPGADATAVDLDHPAALLYHSFAWSARIGPGPPPPMPQAGQGTTTGCVQVHFEVVLVEAQGLGIQDLNIQASLTVEDGQEVVYACCVLGSAFVGYVREHGDPRLVKNAFLG
jgi:hypothetical protein